MAIDALVKPFLLLPLFKGLKPLQLTELVRRADRVIFRAGDIIIEEDQVGDAAIIIVSGDAVRIASDMPGAASEPVPEGAMVGEMAMLVETVHSATIVARSQVKALRLRRSEMLEAMADDPALAEHLTNIITGRLQRFAQELRAIDDALANIASHDIMPSRHVPELGYAPAPLH